MCHTFLGVLGELPALLVRADAYVFVLIIIGSVSPCVVVSVAVSASVWLLLSVSFSVSASVWLRPSDPHSHFPLYSSSVPNPVPIGSCVSVPVS